MSTKIGKAKIISKEGKTSNLKISGFCVDKKKGHEIIVKKNTGKILGIKIAGEVIII